MTGGKLKKAPRAGLHLFLYVLSNVILILCALLYPVKACVRRPLSKDGGYKGVVVKALKEPCSES